MEPSKVGESMRIVTLTAVYNEEFLLPFYLNHYRWCDAHYILYETTTTDQSLSLLQRPNVHLVPTTSPEGIDDAEKTRALNQAYRDLEADVVLCVDADEFIHTDRAQVEQMMSASPVVIVTLCDVFRHHTESDLDPNLPVKEQRRYGKCYNEYQKPCLARTGLPEDVFWTLGHHGMHNVTPANYGIMGSHWVNADPCFSIKRRVHDRSERLSPNNYANRYGTQHFWLNEDQIRQKLLEHSHDPQLW